MSTYVHCALSRNDRLVTRCDVGQVISFDMLPDDVLLEIFHFHMNEARNEDLEEGAMGTWQSLVHVCRRWRSVVFGSPSHLDLRLVCTSSTPVRALDVWPALPLAIRDFDCSSGRVDNIVSLLERSDLGHRITQVILWDVPNSQLYVISEAMLVPFPELTVLELHCEPRLFLPLSDSFLDGSAPRLRYLWLDGIPYPGLPKLRLSATHLTGLFFTNIPHSGYIPPEAMVACISTLTSLERLSLGFESPLPRPDWESQRPSPPKITTLPVLKSFEFKGVCEYLEYLVARIDSPRLNVLDITFFNDIVFDTPQFSRFISHKPMLDALNKAIVTSKDSTASVNLLSVYARLTLRISCRELDWQLSFLEQVCTSSLPPLSTLEDLYMEGHPWPQDWKDHIDYTQWLELLHSFTTVKNLYLSKEFAPHVVSALQEFVGGSTTEVFPNLQNIFLEELQQSGPVQEGIGKFVAARQVTSHLIAVSRWDKGSRL